MARRTAWQDTIVDEHQTATSVQNSLQMMSTLDREEKRGNTITRLIGELGLYSTTVAGAWGVQKYDIGFAMLDDDAFAAAALPDPNIATDYPPRGWLFRTRCVVAQNGTGAPVVTRCVFDIRAQRKMDNAVLVMIVNNVNTAGTSFTIENTGIVRALLLLP